MDTKNQQTTGEQYLKSLEQRSENLGQDNSQTIRNVAEAQRIVNQVRNSNNDKRK